MERDLWSQLEAVREAIESFVAEVPRIVIVTGSGLSKLLDRVAVESVIPFASLPYFAAPTVDGHPGQFVIGAIGPVRVVVMAGRLHAYEGFSPSQVVFPVRALAHAGANTFLLTNASGGLRRDLNPGDLVLIRDHINMSGSNPLVGINDSRLGPRFVPMDDVYDKTLSNCLVQAGKDLAIDVREGVYVGVLGPSYETAAEGQMLARIGGDVVGMSTVSEAIALKHMGCRVAGLATVTNLVAGLGAPPLSHGDVLTAAAQVEQKLGRLIAAAIENF